MKTKHILIAAGTAIVLILAVLIAAYLNNSNQANKENEAAKTDQSASGTQSQSAESTAQTSITAGSYIDYSEDAIKNTKGTKVLFFHAPWCPQCMALDKSIKSGKIPDGVTILKVDYDSNQALRKKYGVTLQTTLVRIDDNGNLIKKYTAYNQPTLQALIDNVL